MSSPVNIQGRWIFRIPGQPKIGALELSPSGTYSLSRPGSESGTYETEEVAPGIGKLLLSSGHEGTKEELEYAIEQGNGDAMEVSGSRWGGKSVKMTRSKPETATPPKAHESRQKDLKPTKEASNKLSISDSDVSSLLSRAGASTQPSQQPSGLPPTEARRRLAGSWWSGGSYSSGYDRSGGYSSEARLVLREDGKWSWKSESVVSISVSGLGGGSVSEESDFGNWSAEFNSLLGSGAIEFVSEKNGETWRAEVKLRSGGSELEVDGRRYGRE